MDFEEPFSCYICQKQVSFSKTRENIIYIYRYSEEKETNFVRICTNCNEKLEVKSTWKCYACGEGNIERLHDHVVAMKNFNFNAIALLCNNPECRMHINKEAADHFKDELSSDCCWSCYKQHPEYRCSKCHQALYCSRDCQKENWRKHKIKCKN